MAIVERPAVAPPPEYGRNRWCQTPAGGIGRHISKSVEKL